MRESGARGPCECRVCKALTRQVVEVCCGKFDGCDPQMIAGVSASDIQQVTLSGGDLVQDRAIRDALDARMRR
jgi:hypothetical protein